MRRPITTAPIAREVRRDQIVVGASLTAFEAVLCAPRGEAEEPLVEQEAVPAERLFERLVRPGDETVE